MIESLDRPLLAGDFWLAVMWLQITLFCVSSRISTAIDSTLRESAIDDLGRTIGAEMRQHRERKGEPL